MKGQTSIELVATVGIALVLAAPFVVEAQGTMIDIGFGSDTAEIQASLDRLADSIRTVASMGEPATRRVQLRLTRDMEDFQISGDRSFIYTMERSGRQSNMTRIFDSKVSASNMPVQQGIYTIEVEAWKDQVNISRVN
jgi:hypothetical protein